MMRNLILAHPLHYFKKKLNFTMARAIGLQLKSIIQYKFTDQTSALQFVIATPLFKINLRLLYCLCFP